MPGHGAGHGATDPTLIRIPPTVRPLALVLVALTVAPAEAQPKTGTHRIGFIGFHSPGLESAMLRPFQARLRELGWVEGGNLSITYRWADSDASRYSAITSELVQSNMDVITTPCGSPVRVIRQISLTLPVVARCMDLKDFGGEIKTPSQPGGYTTGATYLSRGTIAQRLVLLREALPGLSQVGLLYRPQSDWMAHWAEVEAAAKSVDLRLVRLEWVHRHELPGMFDAALRDRVGALLTLGDSATHGQRHYIFALAAERRLPVLYDFPMFPAAEEVGLMAYYASVDAVFRAVAEQVDQILKGKKAGDIPVAIPQTFHLMINQRAARRLGLALPSAFLQRANQVLD